MTKLKNFNLADPAVRECPYPFYKAMRDEEPVYFLEGLNCWIISRYDDCLEALRKPELFSSKMGFRPGHVPDEVIRIYKEEGYGDLPDTLVSNDPPSHTRYRKLVDRAFTAGRVKKMETYIEQVTNEQIDLFIDRGSVEIMRELAIPLPVYVIADQLGVPRSMRDRFKEWSDAGVEPLGMLITPERHIECAKLVVEMQHYLVGVIEDRRRNPQDDMITDLATREVDGELLDIPELLSVIGQLLGAGNETSTSAIGAAVVQMARDPALVERLAAEPDIGRNFAEEILRHEAPVQGLFRRTLSDVTVAGTIIPAGSLVNLRYGSANRDERKFSEPDRFDVDRKNASAHLAFGAGIHHCIGAQLARSEIAMAARQLGRRATNIRLADPDSLEHSPSVILRGLKRVDILFDKR